MSEHCGYVVKVDKLEKHPNADRLMITSFFGNQAIVGLDVMLGEIGIYFPSDLQLSEEFCIQNHLLRKLPDGTADTGYLEPDKRNIRPMRLRGEKSDGIYVSLSAITYTGVNLDDINVGDKIECLNGHEICKKYIPRGKTSRNNDSQGNKTRKKKVPISPLFAEHADTEQLAYNLDAFKPGDEIEITLKMHGTSQRTGYLPVFKGYKRTLLDKLLRREGTPIYDWGYVSGTRRTVLKDFEGGYYGSNEFREKHSKIFEGKLNKGEEVFYEVVGFTHMGDPIMPKGKNKKLNDKEFVKQYGEETVFSYSCRPDAGWKDIQTDNEIPQSDIYVYRMTLINEDGFTVEYTPDFMRYRCEQMGVKCVPILWKGIIPEDLKTEDFFTDDNGNFKDWIYAENEGEWIRNKAEQYYDGPDPIGKTHVREGVVVRILNRPKFAAYKHKNWSFKALEGIVKVEAEAPDMEEAESEANE